MLAGGVPQIGVLAPGPLYVPSGSVIGWLVPAARIDVRNSSSMPWGVSAHAVNCVLKRGSLVKKDP